MKRKNRLQMIFAVMLCAITVIFALNGNSGAVDTGKDDLTPAEVSGLGTGNPNVIFIFDNSDSMRDIPYETPTGQAVRPDWKWQQGPVIENGKVAVDDNGSPVLNDLANLNEELAIPKQEITDISGTITSADSNGKVIYDTEFDWSSYSHLLYQYRIVQIFGPTGETVQERSITGANSSSKLWITSSYQGYSDEGIPIDFTDFNYKNASQGGNYSYTILNSEPGVVTYPTFKNDDYSRIKDANVDWAKVSEQWSQFKDAMLEIIDETSPYNGQQFKITGTNSGSKQWHVKPPLNSDVVETNATNGQEIVLKRGTKYRILGSELKDKYAYGGNHPSSKLYQAKNALQQVLSSSDLQEPGSGDYKINVGFATYLSARVPRTTARYCAPTSSSTKPEYLTYRAMYKRTDKIDNKNKYYNSSKDDSYAKSNFNAGGNLTNPDGTGFAKNKLHTNVSVGYTFERQIDQEKCNSQIVTYTITEINYQGVNDSGEHKYEFVAFTDASAGGGYIDYAWKNHPDLGSIPVTSDFCTTTNKKEGKNIYPFSDATPPTGWELVTSPDPCAQEECEYHPESTSGGNYNCTYSTTYGDYTVNDPKAPGYINQNKGNGTTWVTPEISYESTGSPFSKTNPGTYRIIPDIWMIEDGIMDESNLESPEVIQCEEDDGTWTKGNMDCEGNKRIVLEQVISNWNSTPDDIVGGVFSSDYFFYPADGTTNKPHGWSYKKITPSGGKKYIYQTHPFDNNNSPTMLPWGYGSGEYFKADSAHNTTGTDEKNDYANHRGDDQVLFVNLPPYDDADANFGDDLAGTNLLRVLGVTGLGAVNSPSPSSSDQGDSYFKVKRGDRYVYTMMPYTNSLPVNFDYSAITGGKSTPLGASLTDAKKYFESYYKTDKMSQQGCRGNYIILLTDGNETCDGNPQQVAAELRKLFVTTPERGVKTFVVGFGLDAASKTTLNEIAVAGGTQQAYFASNSEELVEVLLNDILKTLAPEGAYSQSSAVLAREIKTDDDLRIYYSYFDYPGWIGHMEAYLISADDGSIGDPVPGWGTSCSDEGISDAGCQITAQGASNRKIYTWLTGTAMTEFTAANKTALKASLNISTEDIDGDGTKGTDSDAATVIGYVRDPGYESGKYAGTRTPDWLLGDIWHSTPVVVTAPKFDFGKAGYDDFKAASGVSDRPKMIYVGANDGMLHAINDSDGKERWAYIPKCLLYKVQELKYGHRTMVDGPITVADLDLDTASNKEKWTTVLVGGLRDGGNYYYALDVTLPATPKPLWETTDNDTAANSISGTMGNTWSKAAMGIINIGGVETPVVFVGGGYSPNTANKGNKVYILNAVTGVILKEFTIGGTMNNVPGELLTVRYREIGGKAVDFFTEAELDDSYKGNIEVVYFGDTSGALWRIGTEVTDDTPTFEGGLNSVKDGNKYSAWDPRLVKLYEPSEAGHPIFYKPDVADYPDQGKCRFILFGTGNGADLNDTTQQYFCEIEDPSDKKIVNPGESLVTWKTGVGDVPALGAREQVLSDPVVFQGKVYFTTYMPPQPSDDQAQCADIPVGTGYLYVVNVSTCSSVGGVGKRGYLGPGIPTSPVIAAPKVYVHIEPGPPGDAAFEDASGWGSLEITGDGSLKSGAAGGTGAGQMIYWREIE